MRRLSGRARWTAPVLTAALFFACAHTAARKEPPKPEIPAPSHAPQIAAAPTPAAQTPAEKLADIKARHQEKMKEWFETYSATEDKEEKKKLYDTRPGPAFVEEYEKLAAETKGTETEIECWLAALNVGVESQKAQTIAQTLLKEHIDSPALRHLPNALARSVRGPELRPILDDLVSRSPHKPVQAAALLAEARPLSYEDEPPPRLTEIYERLRKDYGDLKTGRGEQTYKGMVDAHFFALANLRVGKVAPDFEATDENGVKFKLSDYRGKVAVIDFWGMW